MAKDKPPAATAKKTAKPADAKVGATAPATTVTPAALTADQTSAKSLVQNVLTQAGLGGLTDLVWNAYITGQITDVSSIDQLRPLIQGTTEYKTRFPGIEKWMAEGIGNNEAAWINLEHGYTDLFHQYGVDKVFGSKADMAQLVTGHVALPEAEQRLQLEQQNALNAPAEVKARLAQFGVGDTLGALTAYYGDPTIALPKLQQISAAAQIAGTADIAKFQGITQDQAMRLASLGVSQSQAQSGFTQLAGLGDVTGQNLPGEKPLGVDDLINAAFAGDATAVRELRQRTERRVAGYNGGGGFTSGQGFTGAGAARSA